MQSLVTGAHAVCRRNWAGEGMGGVPDGVAYARAGARVKKGEGENSSILGCSARGEERDNALIRNRINEVGPRIENTGGALGNGGF